MSLFGKKKEEPVAPAKAPVKASKKLEPFVFKQAGGFRGFKSFRIDRFGCEGNNALLYEAFTRSKGKNALPEGQDYPATIDFFPYTNMEGELCYQVIVDKHLLGFVDGREEVEQVRTGAFDAVYLKTEEEPTKRLKMFVRFK